MDAARAAGLAKGWKITSESANSLTFKEGRNWSGTTHPVTVTASVNGEAEACEVDIQGSVGGLGPIQSKHVRRQVTEFGDLLVASGSSSPTGCDTGVGRLIAESASPDLVQRLSHLHRRVIAYLGENLREGEKVRAVIDGGSNQAIVGTDTRLFVVKVGWLAGATGGVEATSWGYRNIAGIQTHKGMVTGAVIVQAAGQSGVNTSYWGEGKSDPYKAPNAIPVGAGNWPLVKQGVAEIQRLIDEAHNPQQVTQTAPAPTSIAAEIKSLAELHQAGALTDDEFVAAKGQLISPPTDRS